MRKKDGRNTSIFRKPHKNLLKEHSTWACFIRILYHCDDAFIDKLCFTLRKGGGGEGVKYGKLINFDSLVRLVLYHRRNINRKRVYQT